MSQFSDALQKFEDDQTATAAQSGVLDAAKQQLASDQAKVQADQANVDAATSDLSAKQTQLYTDGQALIQAIGEAIAPYAPAPTLTPVQQ